MDTGLGVFVSCEDACLQKPFCTRRNLTNKMLYFRARYAKTRVDFAALHDRKKKIIEFQQYRTSQLEDGRFDLYRSKATFSGDKEIT